MSQAMPKQGTGEFYVAKGELQVTKGDIRRQGDSVPEAFEWRHKTPALLDQGRLMFIPALRPEPPKKIPTNPRPGAVSVSSGPSPSVASVGPLSGASQKKGQPRR